MLSVFFANSFLVTVPLLFAFLRVLSDLGFVWESFWQRTLEWESGFFRGGFLGLKTPVFCPENGDKKFSFSEACFFGVRFLLRRVFSESFAQRTP